MCRRGGGGFACITPRLHHHHRRVGLSAHFPDVKTEVMSGSKGTQ